MKTKDQLLSRLRGGEPLTGGDQLHLTLLLAIPAILAQLSSVLMQYIDSAMVGHLGSNQAASVGLVSTTTWVMSGFGMAVATGFSVQVAHACGAKDFRKAGTLMRQALFSVAVFTLLLGLVAMGISGSLPGWLGGADVIRADAAAYFFIYAAFLPVAMVAFASAAMLQASGNM
ncbi:MAG: MATE family efflux transporter, partial [Bacteroidales bacterium]|nr:MATE family efflux transporter [Bacteroidales bacterium]